MCPTTSRQRLHTWYAVVVHEYSTVVVIVKDVFELIDRHDQ